MVLTMLMMALTMAAAPAMANVFDDDHFLGDRRFDRDHLVRDPFLFDRVDDGTDVVDTTGGCIEVLDTDVDEIDNTGIFVEEEEVKALLCPVFDANGNIIRWQRFRV
jgi:hypothetical protein